MPARNTTPARIVALLAVPVALLAACGDDSGSDGQGAAPSATTAAATSAAATTAAATTAASSGDGYGGGYAVPPTAPAAADGPIQLVDNSEYGRILADGDGKTLYVFLFDKDGKSACDASCASAWPPLLANGEVAVGDGLEDEDFGTITREDGSVQVTFYGHPLYHYGGDKAAGDTKGQGVNEVWYVLDAEGNPVEDE